MRDDLGFDDLGFDEAATIALEDDFYSTVEKEGPDYISEVEDEDD